jgi:hypothetical protein
MFVQVQRADGKATALCGVTGGLLAVSAAGLPTLAHMGWMAVDVVVCTCALLSLGLAASLSALRPVLPEGNMLTGLEAICSGDTAEDVLAACELMTSLDHLRVEASRLATLAGLARRKYRAIKASVDLTVAALLVAGMGLLFAYVMA